MIHCQSFIDIDRGCEIIMNPARGRVKWGWVGWWTRHFWQVGVKDFLTRNFWQGGVKDFFWQAKIGGAGGQRRGRGQEIVEMKRLRCVSILRNKTTK